VRRQRREKRRVEHTLEIELSPVSDYEPFQVFSHFMATERQLIMAGLLMMPPESGEPYLLKVAFIQAEACS
jgi:hypothetical protein